MSLSLCSMPNTMLLQLPFQLVLLDEGIPIEIPTLARIHSSLIIVDLGPNPAMMCTPDCWKLSREPKYESTANVSPKISPICVDTQSGLAHAKGGCHPTFGRLRAGSEQRCPGISCTGRISKQTTPRPAQLLKTHILPRIIMACCVVLWLC